MERLKAPLAKYIYKRKKKEKQEPTATAAVSLIACDVGLRHMTPQERGSQSGWGEGRGRGGGGIGREGGGVGGGKRIMGS